MTTQNLQNLQPYKDGKLLARRFDMTAMYAAATAGILYVRIAVLGPISGAQCNPAVTLAFRLDREISTRDALVYVGARAGAKLRGGGALRDVAPTLLDLLGIDKPAEMSGRSLLEG